MGEWEASKNSKVSGSDDLIDLNAKVTNIGVSSQDVHDSLTTNTALVYGNLHLKVIVCSKYWRSLHSHG